MSDPLLPTPRSLLRREDLGPGPWDEAPDVLALAPVLGWLLDVTGPTRVLAEDGSVRALLARLVEDRATITVLDPASAVIADADLAVLGPDAGPGPVAAVLDAVAAGRLTTAVVPDGGGDGPRVRPATVHLAVGGRGVLLVAATGAVAELAAMDAQRLESWRRTQVRLGAALVAERAAARAGAERDELLATRAVALRDLGRAEEAADRARAEAARLRVRLAAGAGLPGARVHAVDP
ncbi:MAG: hypothetical protein ACO3RG_06910, partial [Nitriliruptoraceae bacterium]